MSRKQTIKKSALIPTALISGGAGFIGSHLAEALLENNARVIVVDNFSTGKEIHVKHLLDNPNFALYDVDINQGVPDQIESVDYIFHFAGLEEYQYSKDLINLESLLTNSLGTKNLLDFAKKSNAKFLLASTVDVYQGRMSQLELSKYFGFSSMEENKFSLTEAKRFGEAMVWEFFKKNDSDVRIVRLPEIYGPRMGLDASGSLGSYLKDIIEKRDITVFGDGDRSEHYLYVADAVSGILKAFFNPNTKGNIYSLVDDKAVTELELAYLVKSLADGEVAVQFKPRSSDYNPGNKSIDTFNLKDLDWSPKMELKVGIIKTLEWFGYQINTYSFKPAKLIAEQQDTQQIFTLQGAVPETVPEKPVIPTPNELQDPYKNLFPQNVPSQKTSITDKKNAGYSNRPRINISLPKSNLIISFFAVLTSCLLVFILMPSVLFYTNFSSGLNSLMSIKEAPLTLDTVSRAREASYKLSAAQNNLSRIGWLFKLLGKEKLYTSGTKALSSLTHFSYSVSLAGKAVTPLESLWEVVRPDTDKKLDASVFETSKMDLISAKNSLNLAKADIYLVNPADIPEKYRNNLQDYRNVLDLMEKGFDISTSVISTLPDILGASGEKRYLIWFQNSNELRPTGGFIGSYGLLKFEGGKLKDLVIDDIYNPDGQIDLRNISVLPPKPIADFLAENKLYLRNSNWDPDFTKSVLAFDDLYYKVKGEKIDGYAALDLAFVQKILQVTGPVFLAAYNEDISAENLYERAQFHSDFNYKDGSDQKRAFLTVLGSKLLERLFALEKDKIPALLKSVATSFTERHALLTLSNSPLNELLKNEKWDGSLVETDGDYLEVVNANLGGTKANYFVKNKMSYKVDSMTRDGLLRGTLTLDYTHTGKDSAWPGGPYTDYLRVLTQSGSKLTGAKLIDESGEKDIFKDVVTGKSGRYTSFETSFKLEPTKSLKIVINYDVPASLSLTKDYKKYSLYWQKQPGTSDDDYYFEFNPPFGFELETLGEGFNSDAAPLVSQGKLNKDMYFSLTLK